MLSKEFVLAGKAVFTISNGSQHYTYKVRHMPGNDRWPESWYIYLLTGPDNTSDYTYVGVLKARTGAVLLTQKSRYTEDSLPVKVVRWAIGLMWSGKPLPEGYSMQHEGRCGRCGRVLTHPESLESGLGPECQGRVGRGLKLKVGASS